MRTQPDFLIRRLEEHNSRLDKEAILEAAIVEGLPEFFHGLQMCLDKLYTFGVKQVPIKEDDDGPQGLPWEAFLELCDQLAKRKLTGHAARDAINLQMACATKQQWNDWYRRILIKDLRCGVSEKTVNKVVKAMKKPEYLIPVFECQLAHDSAKHESKVKGQKIIQQKLDGIRALCVINYELRTVTLWTRNGKQLENFPHICEAIEEHLDLFERSYVLDGEIMSDSFQSLMTQVHRKSDVKSGDAHFNIFDIIPLVEFKAGISTMGQKSRINYLESNFKTALEETGCCTCVPWELVDLDTPEGQKRFKRINRDTLDAGFEGVMIKDPRAKYECKRSTAWLKMKPFIEVSLAIVSVEEGTGRNVGKLGALVCEGYDDGKFIRVNVGSGFTDQQRDEFWAVKDELPGQVVEVRADAITQSQDSDDVYSLRFPRFLHFRGFETGEKI